MNNECIRDTQVGEWISKLSALIEISLCSQQELIGRLSPVSRKDLSASIAESTPEEVIVPIADTLRVLCRSAQILIDRNNDALRQLEI